MSDFSTKLFNDELNGIDDRINNSLRCVLILAKRLHPVISFNLMIFSLLNIRGTITNHKKALSSHDKRNENFFRL